MSIVSLIKEQVINIPRKLTAIAICSTATLLLIGGAGLYVSNGLDGSLSDVNNRGIPGMRSIYVLKGHQQQLALSLLGHILSNSPEQKTEYEKTIEKEKKGIDESLKAYEAVARSAKGKEMAKAEREALAEYVGIMPAVLEKSRTSDTAGALETVAKMSASQEKVTKLIDEHIAVNVNNSDVRAEESHATAQRGFYLSVALILIGSILVGAISLFTNRGINRSLAAMRNAVTRIEGELDFTVKAEVIGKDEIAEVATAINRLLSRLQSNLKSIADGSHSVASAASLMSTTSTQVAKASQQQSESASDMSATVEELTVSINHVGDRAQEANRISSESGTLATSGEMVIGQTVRDIQDIATTVREAAELIHSLEKHSQEISNVVAVIKEVADQTNLLALNAAIEAARAGEQGRGFAVVADEVRKLAERTAVSTKEISETIDVMRTSAGNAVSSMEGVVIKVGIGVESAQEASSTIKRIGEGSRNAVGMVGEITEAIREQATAMNNIATQVERIAQMSEESSAAAANSADTAHDLDRLATDMQRIVSSYKV